MYYTDTINSCLYLLNKYRWMAGDISQPETGHRIEEFKERPQQRPVTKEERQLILKLHNEGKTLTEIVNATNRCNAVVRRSLRISGITLKRRFRQITKKDVVEIERLFVEGMKPAHIAKHLNISNTTVHKHVSYLKKK